MKFNFQPLFVFYTFGTGFFSLAYAFSFFFGKNPIVSNVFLLLAGVLGFEAILSLYSRLKNVQEELARLGVAVAAVGAAGTTIHAGFDLANAIHPGAAVDLPSAIDPRGLLTFGASGLGMFKIAFLMQHDKYFPINLARLGYVSGFLLMLIYFARLIVLDPTQPILFWPVLIEGFVVNPLWYIWLGILIKRKSPLGKT